ncbi:MAG: zinc ABC transporter substrate-binding protein [Verrucomicrobiales bacterium]|nr:zinc ABC transporter substrate-binding protein [Verrucomicrobiales bacterium]
MTLESVTHRYRFPWIALALALMALPVSGAEGRRLKIVTSIAPLYSWATSVAGSQADVENLLPADVSPHDYQLRPRDLRKLKSADILFFNGLGLESWVGTVLAANDPTATRKIVDVATGIATNQLIYEIPDLGFGASDAESHPHSSQANPHLWLDPRYARHGVTNLLLALQREDPANAAAYATNAARYLGTLEKLEGDLRTSLSPLTKHQVVTFHDAFPYFCRRFGLILVGVIEEVPGTSPSPRYLAELSAAIRAKSVGVLFLEPQSDPRLARQLSTDLGIAVAQLDTLETGRLAPEAYEEGMRANLRVLRTALK